MERRNDSNKWHLAMAKREALIKIGELFGVKWPKNPHTMRLKDIEDTLRASNQIEGAKQK